MGRAGGYGRYSNNHCMWENRAQTKVIRCGPRNNEGTCLVVSGVDSANNAGDMSLIPG